jgi:hypothetical protein
MKGMAGDRQELQVKLDEIDARINEIRHRIELRGILDHDHHATRVELQERHQILATQLRQDVADLEAHGHHVSALEQMVLDWANRLNF